jgi:hypothetical protein
LSDYVSRRLRAAIAHRAKGCCEYCGSPAKFCIDPFVAEHIHPVAKGGLTVADNLALACMGCNGYKQDKTEAYDAVSQAVAPLYHPRTHLWHEHFAWNEEFTHLVPLTAIGRVTIAELQLNRAGVINVRLLLILAGLHPPRRY